MDRYPILRALLCELLELVTSPTSEPAPVPTSEPAPVSTSEPAPVSTSEPAPVSTEIPATFEEPPPSTRKKRKSVPPPPPVDIPGMREQITTAISAMLEAGKRPAIVNLLETYGVDRARSLSDEQVPNFLLDLNALQNL